MHLAIYSNSLENIIVKIDNVKFYDEIFYDIKIYGVKYYNRIYIKFNSKGVYLDHYFYFTLWKTSSEKSMIIKFCINNANFTR